MKKGFFLSAVTLLSLAALTGCNSGGGDSVGEIKVWVDTLVKPGTETLLESFKTAHPEYNVSFKVEAKSEMGITGEITKDPDAAADVYIFAQDQLARLVAAKAITKLPAASQTAIAADDEENSVKAVTINNVAYAYPVTDNSVFMYYDKRVVSDTAAGDLDQIVEACEGQNKYIYFNTSSANSSNAFFYGVGAKSEWTVDADGNFIAKDDDFASKGLKAMKALNKLCMSSAFQDGSDASKFASGAAVVFSGAWDKKVAEQALTANLGIAKMPQFKVGTETFDMKPFAAYKMAGVKPQKNSNRAKVAHEVALALAGKDGQQARFTDLGWVPCNKALKETDAVKADKVVAALNAQAANAHVMGQYPEQWWNYAATLGKGITTAKTDTQLQGILDTYNTNIAKLLS